jgi:hypothetical protein
MSANVVSLGSSAARGLDLADVDTGNAADVDATPLRARKSEIVRMASPQPDTTSRLIQIFATGHNQNTDGSGESNHISQYQVPVDETAGHDIHSTE